MKFYKNPKTAAVAESTLFWASILILGLSAIGKAALVWAGHSYLALDNQVFLFLTNGALVRAVIVIELVAIVSMLLLRKQGRGQWGVWILGWLLAAFVTYHAALGITGVEKNCLCFGILADILNGRGSFVKALTTGCLAVFFLSILATIWSYKLGGSLRDHSPERSSFRNIASHTGMGSLLVLFLMVPQPAVAKTVRLEGELQFSFFRQNGTLMTNQIASFAVERNSTNWSLQVTLPGGGMWRYYSTGKDVVGGYYGEFDDPLIKNPPQPVTAWLGCDPFDNYYVQLPWLAYLTENCLANDIPAPWLDSQYQSEAHAYKNTVSSYFKAPSLPEEVLFITDKQRMEDAPMSRMLHREGVTKEVRGPMQHEISYPSGFTSAVYRATSWSEQKGEAFPREFELVKYQETATDHGGIVQLRFAGKLTNRTESAGQIVPPIFTNTLVYDRRFRDDTKVVDFIRYKLENKSLPPMSDSNLVSLFEVKRAAAPFDVSYRMRHLISYMLFAFLLVVPLGIVVWRVSVARKNKQSKRN